MKPIEVRKALEKCAHLGVAQDMFRRDALAHMDWAVDGYIQGWLTHEEEKAHIEDFLKEAERLIVQDSMNAHWKWMEAQASRELTPAEIERKKAWLQAQAESAARTELRRQMSRLREGHQTLSAIRKLLAHGLRSYPGPESGQARTSPTS